MGMHVLIRDVEGRWHTPAIKPGTLRASVTVEGCDTAQFELAEPSRFGRLAPDCLVRIGDETGTLWTGTVGIPGRTSLGQHTSIDSVGCVGNVSRLTRAQFLAPWLVTRLDAWIRDTGVKPNSESTQTTHPEAAATQGMLQRIPQGAAFNWDTARMFMTAFRDSGTAWTLGGIAFSLDHGIDDPKWSTAVYWDQPGWGHRALTKPSSTAASSHQLVSDGSTARPHGVTAPYVEWRYDNAGGGTITTDDKWQFVYGVTVKAAMVNRVGVRQPVGSPVVTLASDVVEDICGRFLGGLVDTGSSLIEKSTALIYSIDYSDGAGATVRDILDDLLRYEPGMLWQWGLEDLDGKATMTFQSWPTTPRYVLPAVSGVDVSEQGGESDLCDRVTVMWTDRDGRKKYKVYVADRNQFPDTWALPTQGRAAPTIDLGAQHGLEANADRVGAAVLAQVATRPMSATAKVPADVMVLDVQSGNVVPARRMRPGHLVQHQATGRTYPLTGVEWGEDGATLALGRPRRTSDQIIADLERRRVRR